ncbi:MAG: UDP-N-acetylmuramoyl-L-alanyl-D-glutamate--2,6-diaminopimelate ligase [Magnetococcus sp. YQC-5]
MKLSQLHHATLLPDLFHLGPDIEITGITADSRNVVPGSLFAALSGQHAHGSQFVSKAVTAGAVAILHDGSIQLPSDLAQWIHPDPRRALAHIAAAFHDHPARQLRMIAVTGSNGKTTVAAMVESILLAGGITPGVIGTTGVRYPGMKQITGMTTPDPITLHHTLREMVTHGCTDVIAEVSSHALTQFRTDGIRWEGAAFTNLTHDHLDYHGSMENYWQAKQSLFLTAPYPARAVINLDDPRGAELIRQVSAMGIPVSGFTLDHRKQADFLASDIVLDWKQTRFWLKSPGHPVLVTLKAGGRFNSANALTAAALCWHLGLREEVILAGLNAFRPVRGRMEPIDVGQPFTVIVDFAHTPDALERLLITAREISPDGRRLLVFGCGGERDTGKRPIMGAIAGRLANETIITDDNPRSEDPEAIRQAIQVGLKSVQGDFTEIGARDQAIGYALSRAKAGDVVLIAGKGHETEQITATGSHPFDDAQIVRDYLGK